MVINDINLLTNIEKINFFEQLDRDQAAAGFINPLRWNNGFSEVFSCQSTLFETNIVVFFLRTKSLKN